MRVQICSREAALFEGHGHGIGHARRCHDLLRTDWLDAARYIGVRDFSVQLVCCR